MLCGLSCSVECGIFPDQGWNLCFLHRQVNSTEPPGKSKGVSSSNGIIFILQKHVDSNICTFVILSSEVKKELLQKLFQELRQHAYMHV